MQLINAYINEVGLHLPGKMRKDVQAEIRSTIEDMLEDQGIDPALEENQDAVAEILKELGPPNKVASGYKGSSNYLIGPQLYPMFVFITRIILIVVVGSLALSWVVGNLAVPGIVDQPIFKWMDIFELITAMISLFGWMTIIFVVLDRVLDDRKKDNMKMEMFDNWNPLDLLKEEWAQPIKPLGVIISIIISVAVLIVVNFYPQFIAIYSFQESGMIRVPLFNESASGLYLLISVFILIGIAYNIVLLRTGRWTTLMRWLNIAMDALTAAFFFFLTFSGVVFGTSEIFDLNNLSKLSELGDPNLIAENVAMGVGSALTIAFFVAAIVLSIFLIIRTVKLIRIS